MSEEAGQEADRKVDAAAVSSESGQPVEGGMTFDELVKYIKDTQNAAATKTEQARIKAEAPAEWKRGQDIVDLTDAVCQVTQRSYESLTDQDKKAVEEWVDKGFNQYGDVKIKDGFYYVYAKNEAGELSEPLIIPWQENMPTPIKVEPTVSKKPSSAPVIVDRTVATERPPGDQSGFKLPTPELRQEHARAYDSLVAKTIKEGGYQGLIASLKDKDPEEAKKDIKALQKLVSMRTLDNFLTDEVVHGDDFQISADVSVDGTFTQSSSHYTQTLEAQGRLDDLFISTYGKDIDEFAKSIGASSPEELRDLRNLIYFGELPKERENEKQIASNE